MPLPVIPALIPALSAVLSGTRLAGRILWPWGVIVVLALVVWVQQKRVVSRDAAIIAVRVNLGVCQQEASAMKAAVEEQNREVARLRETGSSITARAKEAAAAARRTNRMDRTRIAEVDPKNLKELNAWLQTHFAP